MGDGFRIDQSTFPATLVANAALSLPIEFGNPRYSVEPRDARLRCTVESADAVVEAEWPLRARVLPDIFASGFGD